MPPKPWPGTERTLGIRACVTDPWRHLLRRSPKRCSHLSWCPSTCSTSRFAQSISRAKTVISARTASTCIRILLTIIGSCHLICHKWFQGVCDCPQNYWNQHGYDIEAAMRSAFHAHSSYKSRRGQIDRHFRFHVHVWQHGTVRGQVRELLFEKSVNNALEGLCCFLPFLRLATHCRRAKQRVTHDVSDTAVCLEHAKRSRKEDKVILLTPGSTGTPASGWSGNMFSVAYLHRESPWKLPLPLLCFALHMSSGSRLPL